MGSLIEESGSAALPPCAPCYVSVDALGSTRMLTDSLGIQKERHDYMSFGDEVYAGSTAGLAYPGSSNGEGMNTMYTGQGTLADPACQ